MDLGTNINRWICRSSLGLHRVHTIIRRQKLLRNRTNSHCGHECSPARTHFTEAISNNYRRPGKTATARTNRWASQSMLAWPTVQHHWCNAKEIVICSTVTTQTKVQNRDKYYITITSQVDGEKPYPAPLLKRQWPQATVHTTGHVQILLENRHPDISYIMKIEKITSEMNIPWSALDEILPVSLTWSRFRNELILVIVNVNSFPRWTKIKSRQYIVVSSMNWTKALSYDVIPTWKSFTNRRRGLL